MSRQPRQTNVAGAAPRAGRRAVAPRAGQPRAPLARSPARRHTREQQSQRLAIVAGGAIVLVVAALLGFGWYQSYELPYRQTVISVGSMRVTMQYYVNRMKQLVPQFSGNDADVVVNALPEATIETIETDFVTLQRADRLGVSVTGEQVDAAMQSELGLPQSSGIPYAGTRPNFEAMLDSKLATTGLTFAEYRQEIQAQALASQIKDQLAAAYPKTGPQARYETITAPSQSDAQKLVDRLNSGTDWETLVTEVHNNPSSGSVQQNDFQPKLQVDDKLADPLFQLDADGHTGVVTTSDGKTLVARLIEKDDQRPISDDQLKAITPKLYSNWLVNMRKTLTVKDSMSDSQKLFAVEHSGYKPPAQSQSPAQPQAPPPANPQQAPQFNPANLPPGLSTPTGGFGSGAVPAPAGTQGP